MKIFVRIRRASIQDQCFWFLLACCTGTLALAVLAHFSYSALWDDALFFPRYADNLISSGKLAWDPGGEPTYGLTSPLYLILVVPLRLLLNDNLMLTAWLASVISGCALLFLLLLIALRRRENPFRPLCVALVFFGFANSTPLLFTHLTNGMDALFAATYLAIYLLVLGWYERRPTPTRLLTVAILGAGAFWVRPDLMVYTLGIPAAILLLDQTPRARPRALAILGITFTLTLGEIIFNSAYFHSPLPLPFYAKGMRLYGDYIYTRYGWNAGRELGGYLQAYGIFFCLIGVSLFLNFKEWRSAPASEKAILVATLIFIGYYLFFVLQIMGFSARFYMPTLPAVVYLAISSLIRLMRHMQPYRDRIGNISARTRIAATSLLLAPLLTAALAQLDWGRNAIATGDWGRFDFPYTRQANMWWFRLDEFSKLPDGLVIATTETGAVGVMNPRKVVVDLAGLNTQDFSHPPFSANLLFDKYHPDLIYLPHPDYREMILEIKSHPAFQKNYDYFDGKLLGAFMDVAIWRDSPYYSALRRIVDQGKVP